MKFSHEGDYKMIFKNTKAYINNLEKEIINFKEFCISIANENNPSPESNCYYNFTKSCDNMYNTLISYIQEPLFKLQQKYDDMHRPSVLYPYEKQAIYEYLTKPDIKHKCMKKFGCIYAEKIKIDDKEVVTIGISVCNDIDSPLFSKNIAVNLAKKRAREYPKQYNIRVSPIIDDKHFFTKMLRIPTKIMYRNEINKFMTRCSKWFKGENILYPTNINFEEFLAKENKKKKSDKITNKEMPF